MHNNKVADKYRAGIQRRLQKEKERKNQQKIAALEALIQLKDEELAAKGAELKSNYDIDVEMEDVPEVHENNDENKGENKDEKKDENKDERKDENKDEKNETKNEGQDDPASTHESTKIITDENDIEKKPTPVEKTDEAQSTGEPAKKADGKKKAKTSKGETDHRKSRKSPSPKIMQSIERDDVSDDSEYTEDEEEGQFSAGDDISDSETDYDSDSDPELVAYSDEEYGRALYSFPGTTSAKDVKSVGWSSGRFAGYVNQYGKKSAARYRLGKFAFPAEYEDRLPREEKISNPNNRYGDKRKADGKFKYTKRHILGIFAVAWRIMGTHPSRDDLRLIDPNLVTDWRKVPTYILILWDIDGERKKAWEPRSALRDRWGKKEADHAIYLAAVEAENRYREAKTGRRIAKSKSPSVGLVDELVRKQREKSLEDRKLSLPRSTHAVSESPDELVQLLTGMMSLLGVSNVNELKELAKKKDRGGQRHVKMRPNLIGVAA